MNVPQLQKIWNKLDRACKSIERLEKNGIDVFDEYNVDGSAIDSLRSKVEELIAVKSRKK